MSHYHRAVLAVLLGPSLIVPLATAGPESPQPSKTLLQDQADRFLDLVNSAYMAVYTVEQRALWDASTDVNPEHDAAAAAASKARAAFNGNPALIRQTRDLLSHKDELDPVTVRQLRQILLNAAEGPMTNPTLVAARIEAETEQASTLNSFVFKLRGQPISTNDIDDKLTSLTDLKERLVVWEASKESGPALKPGLVKLQGLRNGVARELGYPDYFSLQVAATT